MFQKAFPGDTVDFNEKKPNWTIVEDQELILVEHQSRRFKFEQPCQTFQVIKQHVVIRHVIEIGQMQDVTFVGRTEGFVAVVINISDDWRTQLDDKYS